MQASNSPTN